MARMFMDASGFTGGDIFTWSMTRVTDVSDMFNGAVLFNANLTNWGGTTGFGVNFFVTITLGFGGGV